MGKKLLAFNRISKRFPGVRALDDISFSLKEGEVLALLGENGAGKSTLIKCLTGAHTLTSGTIEIFGKSYNSMDPKVARKLGISAVYQEFNLVPDLPVVENVFMGNNPGNGIVVDYKEMVRRAQEIFEFFGVNIDPEANVSTLSPAMMQIVEIAKATALDARILILDEPTAPLTMNETKILFDIIENVKKKGVSVIYISHRLEEIFQICDRIVVLRDGQMVGEMLVKETERQELIKMMIGRELKQYYPDYIDYKTDDVVLRVKNFSGNGIKDVSFELHKGEVLGFAGLVGAGRTELMSLIFADVAKDSGEMEINHKPFKGDHPWKAIKEGIAFLPEDRKQSGLLLEKSIAENVTLSCIKQLCRFGVIDFAREGECVDSYCTKLQVKTPDYEQPVGFLSGGNQQKVIIAKWLATDSNIVIFDEPTRGIDVGAKREIYEIIKTLAKEGKAIIMVSSEFEELIGVADRIAVMSEGALAGFVDRNEFEKEHLLDMASGNR